MWLFREPQSDRNVYVVAKRVGAWMWQHSSCYVAGQRCPSVKSGSWNQHTDTMETSDKTQTDRTETPCVIWGGGRTWEEEEQTEEKSGIIRLVMDSWRDKEKGFVGRWGHRCIYTEKGKIKEKETQSGGWAIRSSERGHYYWKRVVFFFPETVIGSVRCSRL